MTAKVIRSATRCCSALRGCWVTGCGRPTSLLDSGGTSSPSFSATSPRTRRTRSRATSSPRFGPSRRDELRTRQQWLQRLREAIEEGGFELHAQPILDLGTGDVKRYELLLRLHDGMGQIVAPSEFLGLAERFGMITDIDLWVVREATQLLREANASGQEVTAEVNISVPTLTGARLLAWLDQQMIRGGIWPGQLILEVTETAAIVNMDDARVFAQRLRDLGCLLSLVHIG